MKGNFFFGFIVAVVIFVPLERIFALRKEQKVFRKGWRTDIIHFLINRFLTDIGLVIVFGSLLIFLHFLVNTKFQTAVAGQPHLLQFLEAVFLADLGEYIGHRMTHRIPWLWKFHAVHHSIEEMDWLAAARTHPLDQAFTRAMAITPLYLMGFSKATFGAYLGIATFQAILIHANVRFKFGWLRWFISTPEFHHWHHSSDSEAIDKNFAGQLPWLDLIFGTLYMPKDKMPETYGTLEPLPSSYIKQMLYPFRKDKSAITISQTSTDNV
ncbi:MAG TPA: sterol desaturase family protein [Blastocatellia bacterium]|nr:sterol desaturase family protein [Blastocatellia bacterium]